MRPSLVPSLFLVLATAGCASAGRLAEYDFRDRTVAVVHNAPPRAEIASGFDDPPVEDENEEGGSLLGAILGLGSEIAREYQTHKAGPRLDSAARNVDVPGLMAERVLADGTRLLGARPVHPTGGAERPDFEIELRVKRYGIEADGWDGQARFFVAAEVLLLDGATGREIWKTKVDEKEPIDRATWGGGAVDALLTASTFSRLSSAEMEVALAHLADYCADAVTEKLRKGIDKARDQDRNRAESGR